VKAGVFGSIALKYLWRYRRRYLFLFLTLGFSFGVVTAISALKDGMKENLYLSAQSHYAGDIVADGRDPSLKIDHHLSGAELEAILASSRAAGIVPAATVPRTVLFGGNEGTVYFNGNAVALKYTVGVDWEKETPYFSRLTYTEAPGTMPETMNDDSILLSAPIAQELGAQKGDSVILETKTASGERNTGTFVAAGIVNDSSFFGYYKVYLSRQSLNRLIGFADGDCSLVGFFFNDRNQRRIEQKRAALHGELSSRIPAGPLTYDRESFDRERDAVKDGSAVFLLTLPVYLSEVAQLMNAIDLASWVLYAMMLAIIMVSAAVTCRLILHERTRETGTMRAIGCYESDVRFVFKLEIFVMALFSMIAGFFLALLVNSIISGGSFAWVPGFEVFLQNGKLDAVYLPGTVAVNALAVSVMLTLAIWSPIFRNSRSPLPGMLSGGAL
jgi:ABC-type lipoprotein release transport system permease subunit